MVSPVVPYPFLIGVKCSRISEFFLVVSRIMEAVVKTVILIAVIVTVIQVIVITHLLAVLYTPNHQR